MNNSVDRHLKSVGAYQGDQVAEQDGKRIIWVDLETTGLNHLTDLILEVGIRITTPSLELIDEYDVVIWDSPTYDMKYDELRVRAASGDENAAYVYNMHFESGLWDEAVGNGLTPADAEKQLVDWLTGHGVPAEKLPMAGSSVHFDRTFLFEDMPALASCFGYRNIDISSIKELCKLISPELYAKLDKYGPQKREKHRALADLEDTTGEAGWYIQNFLHSEIDVVV